MNIEKVVLLAGGDSRYLALAGMFAAEKEQYRVYAVGFDCPELFPPGVRVLGSISEMKRQPDFLILPMPVSLDGVSLNAPLSRGEGIAVSHLLDLCHKSALVLGGRMGAAEVLCGERALDSCDYLKREEFAVMNAIPTAEGALQFLMEQLPVTIFGTEILVTGFGRISKILVKELLALGAKVTVAARKHEDFVWAQIYGAKYTDIRTLGTELPQYDVVVNTVPAMIFGEKEIALTKPNCFFMDLASLPGGIDLAAVEKLGRRGMRALSLPGKVAPESAARFLKMTIDNCINEWEGGKF